MRRIVVKRKPVPPAPEVVPQPAATVIIGIDPAVEGADRTAYGLYTLEGIANTLRDGLAVATTVARGVAGNGIEPDLSGTTGTVLSSTGDGRSSEWIGPTPRNVDIPRSPIMDSVSGDREAFRLLAMPRTATRPNVTMTLQSIHIDRDIAYRQTVVRLYFSVCGVRHAADFRLDDITSLSDTPTEAMTREVGIKVRNSLYDLVDSAIAPAVIEAFARVASEEVRSGY